MAISASLTSYFLLYRFLCTIKFWNSRQKRKLTCFILENWAWELIIYYRRGWKKSKKKKSTRRKRRQKHIFIQLSRFPFQPLLIAKQLVVDIYHLVYHIFVLTIWCFKVARDDDLVEQIGKDIYFDLVDHDKVRSFRIQKQIPFNLFKVQSLGFPVSERIFCFSISIWPFFSFLWTFSLSICISLVKYLYICLFFREEMSFLV